MAEYNIKDFIKESEKQEKFYKEQISKFDNLLNDYETKKNDLLHRKETVLEGIVKKFVPSLNQEYLDNFSKIFSSSEPKNFLKNMEKEKELLKNKITKIEADEEFIKRDALSDPDSGVIVTQIQEIKPLYNSAKANLEKITSFSGFEGLRERHYGTDLYPHKGFAKYFSPEYYRDWKNGDMIIEALKVNNFVEVLTMYQQSLEQTQTLGASLKDYDEQLKRIKKLTEEYKESKYLLEHIEEIYYKKLKDIIYNFYKSSDKQVLIGLIEQYKDTEEQFKMLDGIDHQIEYLQSLYEKVTNDRNNLVTKAGKLSEEASKYRLNEYKYRNKRFTGEQFNKKFNRDEDKYDKMYDRYDSYGNAVYVFNDYGRSSFISDFLWWDLISDGRLDGNFIPEVNEFHSTHPDYSSDLSSTSYDQS